EMEALHGYPRVQMERSDWMCLDGEWDFALDAECIWREPHEPDWNLTIRVPFAPETKASGVENTGFYRACWYRRRFRPPRMPSTDRLLLHFGAVDYNAKVWV